MTLSPNGVPGNHQRQTVPKPAESMINSTTSSGRTAPSENATAASPKPAVRGIGSDKFTPQQSAALNAALQSQPEIRAEEVARAKALAADPNYPSPEIIRGIAGQILRAPDGTEDVS
jgi:hypothetical protein